MEMPSQQDSTLVIFFSFEFFFLPNVFFLFEGGRVAMANRKQARQSQKKRPVRNLWSPDNKELTDNPVPTEDTSANSHMLQSVSVGLRQSEILP